MKGNKKVLFLAQGAAVAAMYAVLTLLISFLGLANGAIQIRISEALTVLPAFMPAAVPGLFIGCLLSNLISGCVIWDIVFGSLATLLGACFTYLIGKYAKGRFIYLACLPPVLANTLIIPFILSYAYGSPESLLFLFATIFAGEAISCGVFGSILIFYLNKHKNRILPNL
ncbi:MAG: QueT transporter family protein [Clostridiales bacterium]|nr:QueT transporter family protein [Clostridiales bacterium]